MAGAHGCPLGGAQVMLNVKNLAAKGLTICATIHSPSARTFALFDSLLLLLRGRVTYFGPRGARRRSYQLCILLWAACLGTRNNRLPLAWFQVWQPAVLHLHNYNRPNARHVCRRGRYQVLREPAAWRGGRQRGQVSRGGGRVDCGHSDHSQLWAWVSCSAWVAHMRVALITHITISSAKQNMQMRT